MRLTWDEIASSLEMQIGFCQGYSPLYEGLYRWLHRQATPSPNTRGGQALVEMVEAAWEGRPINGGLEASLMLPAAIHAALLLEDSAAEALKPFYATLGGQYDGSKDQIAFEAALDDLFAARSEAVEWFLRERLVQTNEISRSAAWLLVAYALRAWQPDLTITLVELGCSGGLNLSADYQPWAWELNGQRYVQRDGEVAVQQRLHLEDASDPAMPDYLSRANRGLGVIQRIGFDRSPLDIHSELDQAALKACIWGDQPERMTRFNRAVEGVRAMEADGQTMRLYQGDILQAAQHLPHLITAETPGPHLLLVYNSAVTTYFGDTDYHELRTHLMHSFQRLPQGVRGLWLENETPRYNEPLERPKHFMLRARLPFMGGISSLYLGELEAHPQNVYLRKGWGMLRELLLETT